MGLHRRCATIDLYGAKFQKGFPSISNALADRELLALTFAEMKKIVPAECQKKLDLCAKLDKLLETSNKNLQATNETLHIVKRPIPSPHEYAVTPKQLEGILTRLNAKRTARTIQLWDKYLKTKGKEGVQPLDDYNLYTRLTTESATAWARHFAARERSRLNTKISLDERHYRSSDNETINT